MNDDGPDAMGKIGSIASHEYRRLDGNGLAQHPLTHSRAETALGHDIHAPAQQVLEIHEQAAEIEHAPSRSHPYKKVDVARLVGFSTRDGTEYANIGRPILGGET